MGGVGACQADVLLNCRPCEVDAEFHEFATDAIHAPEAVLPGHLLDQSDGFRGDPGAPTPIAKLEPPK
jgi:hypothetical protein